MPSRRFHLHLSSAIWLSVALAALTYSFVQSGTGTIFLGADAPLTTQIGFVLHAYLWPGFLAFAGLGLLQLQFLLSAGGQPMGVVFGMSVIASLALLHAIQLAAAMPNSVPAYVVGMALSYTVLSRVYAVQMRRSWGSMRLPWIIWRGDRAAVAEMDRRIAEMRAAKSGSRMNSTRSGNMSG